MDFTINDLNDEDIPCNGGPVITLDIVFTADSNGIRLFTFNGNTHYHPLDLSFLIYRYLYGYRHTDNPEYLDRARLYADKLLDISTTVDSAIYFPYTFDFPLHKLKDETMFAPWYSGIAQGQALSAFVRMYRVTQEIQYLRTADKIFTSFSRFKGSYEPWTVFIDSTQLYCIEEYPLGPPTRVLNGFIYGIVGLYEYYLVTRNPHCKELLLAALTTIHTTIHLYRYPHGVSYYCLRHKIQNSRYHILHTELLGFLYQLTSHECFQTMANLFYDDYHE